LASDLPKFAAAPKQKPLTSFYFPISFCSGFGRFVTRGVRKHEKLFSDGLFSRKSPSGLITKKPAFFPSVFFYLGAAARDLN
jgi:hypothetical protein